MTWGKVAGVSSLVPDVDGLARALRQAFTGMQSLAESGYPLAANLAPADGTENGGHRASPGARRWRTTRPGWTV
jgi:hypothetical protein